jgi:hypothetical protein
MKGFLSVFTGAILLASIGYNLILTYQVSRMSSLKEFATERQRINDDQFTEMFFNQMNGLRENIADVSYQQGKLEGITSVAFNVPPAQNQHSAIWHAGYQRGQEVGEFESELAFENGYKLALDDMKAPADSKYRKDETIQQTYKLAKEGKRIPNYFQKEAATEVKLEQNKEKSAPDSSKK